IFGFVEPPVATIEIVDFGFVRKTLPIVTSHRDVALREPDGRAQALLAIFESSGNAERLMGIENVELQINRPIRTLGPRRVELLNRAFHQKVRVLCLDRELLSIGLLDPSAQSETGRLAVL